MPIHTEKNTLIDVHPKRERERERENLNEKHDSAHAVFSLPVCVCVTGECVREKERRTNQSHWLVFMPNK